MQNLTLEVISSQVLNPVPYTEEVIIEFKNSFDKAKSAFLRIPVALDTGYTFINQHIKPLTKA